VEVRETLRVRVEEASQTGEARRLAVSVCRNLGFPEADLGTVSLLVTEAATNLVKHARGGELLLRPLGLDGAAGIEILAVDRGPGMANPSRSLRDGFSTAGSPGTGLGALQRASSAFDLYSEPGKGTVVACRYWPSLPGEVPPRPLETGVVCLTMTEGEPCGDTWAVEQGASRSLVLVCDGLGHGLLAAEASQLAEKLFRDHLSQGPAEIVEALHQGLRSTRGAALAVLEADHVRGVVRYCGLGNVDARILAGEDERHLVSHAGIAGYEARRIQELSYPWPEGGLLVIHSDGLGTSWRLASYPGLASHHPSVVAAVLYRDFRRGRDDTTVLVARRRATGATPASPPGGAA
jgi:anti-sigma regulatory factor (Ser/Thr protein kinase)